MRDEFKSLDNWKSRGYLPHYEAQSKYQFITYRLADSTPQKLIQKIYEKYSKDSEENNQKKRIEIENLMDKGYGSGILKNPKAAKIIIDGWKFFDKEKYDLCSYVVMPNHVHLLIKTYEEPVSRIIKSWKSFTAKAIRKCFASSNHAE